MPDGAGVRNLKAPIPAAPPLPSLPTVDRFRLDSGLRVVAVRRHDLPQAAIRAIVPAGSVQDPGEVPGLASLVGALLTEGTETRSATDLNERIDSLGASMGARVGHDHAEVDLSLLSETFDTAIRLLAEVLTRAAFPEREVERIRLETVDMLEAREDEPANVADDRISAALFGEDHPYGRISVGTIDGVQRSSRDALLAFHRRWFRPDGTVLILAGDLPGRELRSLLEEAFAGWSGSTPSPVFPATPPAAMAAGQRIAMPWPDAAQGEIRLASIGLTRSSPDWIPGAVANYILGGSTITGRLGANLREDKGWTYGVRSGFAAGLRPAGWSIETAVDGEVTEGALAEIERELLRMVNEPVTKEELDRAKEALILSLPRAFETPARIVSRLSTLEGYGLEPDYWQRFPERVQRVTSEDVQRIAAEHFSPHLLARVTVGPGA
jgi:zinc protease